MSNEPLSVRDAEALARYGRTVSEALETDTCVRCGCPPHTLYNSARWLEAIERRDFQITGLCPTCYTSERMNDGA